jgi:hypothetical protein
VSDRDEIRTEHVPIATAIPFSHSIIISWTGRRRLSPCSVAFFPADRSLVVRTLLRPRRSKCSRLAAEARPCVIRMIVAATVVARGFSGEIPSGC